MKKLAFAVLLAAGLFQSASARYAWTGPAIIGNIDYYFELGKLRTFVPIFYDYVGGTYKGQLFVRKDFTNTAQSVYINEDTRELVRILEATFNNYRSVQSFSNESRNDNYILSGNIALIRVSQY